MKIITAVRRKSGPVVFSKEILRSSLPHPFFPYSPLGSPSAAEKLKELGPESPFPAICWRKKDFPPPRLKERKESELITTCKPAGGPSAGQWCNSAQRATASSFAENEGGNTETETQREREKEKGINLARSHTGARSPIAEQRV